MKFAGPNGFVCCVHRQGHRTGAPLLKVTLGEVQSRFCCRNSRYCGNTKWPRMTKSLSAPPKRSEGASALSERQLERQEILQRVTHGVSYTARHPLIPQGQSRERWAFLRTKAVNPFWAFHPLGAGNSSDGSVPKLDGEGETQPHVPKVPQVPHTPQEPLEPINLPGEPPNDVPVEVGVDGATDGPRGVHEGPEVPEPSRGNILALVPVEAEGAPTPGAVEAPKVVTTGLGAAPAVTELLEGSHPLLIWRAWNTHPEIKFMGCRGQSKGSDSVPPAHRFQPLN